MVHSQKTNKELKSLWRQEIQILFTKTNLIKLGFQYNMTYGKSKDLAKRAQSGKVLRDKAFRIASDLKYGNYQRGLASMVYKFFDKKSGVSGIANEPKLSPVK